jgi:hypothetical protein
MKEIFSRELVNEELVQTLSLLLLSPRIDLLSLIAREHAQRLLGDAAVEGECL